MSEILIITEKKDNSAFEVGLWLQVLNKKHYFLYYEDLSDFSLSINNEDVNTIVSINDRFISGQTTIWHRRASIKLFDFNTSLTPNERIYLKSEHDNLLWGLEDVFKVICKKYIGGYNQEIQNSKIKNNLLAVKFGFNVPSSTVSNLKSKLTSKMSGVGKNKKRISKDLFRPVRINYEDYKKISAGTLIVKSNYLRKLAEHHFPIYLQKYIKKAFEIRTFYFEGKTYSMAILSQSQKSSKIDFRNAKINEMPRCIPFKLETDIEIKIGKLMRCLGLKTGSIDFLVNSEGTLFFLEINPQGQFDWLSKRCNYHIEREIALFL